ncbi:MAG: glycosyltransferase family 2 protein [Desulfobacteraceae bacterium]|nr:glycosyltransferase family 2 protein [Desulfobacteraceae bacterium]
MPSAPLSVAIITKNEEQNLPDCLGSVAFADEIVVLDSGSTDRTGEIARDAGAMWFCEPWKGYGAQKNSALQKCSHDWVLVVDADERVPVQTAGTIREILAGGELASAYAFRRKNYFHGRWIKGADWWPDYVVRLKRRSRGRYEGSTHEKWTTDGEVKRLDCSIEHFSFHSYSDLFRALNDYSTQLAEQMYSRGKRGGPLDAFSHGLWTFLRSYFLKLGFSEGFDGLMISLTQAGGTFLKYSKLYEMDRFGGALEDNRRL